MGKRYISVEREGGYGVYRGNNLQYIDIVSESVAPDQGMIDIETAGEREWRYRVPGAYSIGGDIDLVVNADNITRFLWWCLGSKVSTDDGSDHYKHIFESAQEFDSFSMNIAPAVQDTAPGGLAGYAMRRVVGCAVTSIAFEAVAREALTATVSVIGQQDSLVADAQSPSFSTVRPFIFYEGAVSVQGSQIANVEAFRVTIDNEVADDAFVLGSRFLPALRIQGITITGSMDLAFENWDMYRYFYNGTSTGSSPGTSTLNSIELDLTFTGQSLGGAGDYANYKLQLNLPQCYLDTTAANFDRRDRIVQSVDFTATYDDVDGYTLQATVVNGQPLTTTTTTSTTSTSTSTT